MTELVLTYNDVLRAVRTSRCVTTKKHNPAKTRIGVYGETFQHAVSRLADKLGAPFRVVMQFVTDLQAKHKLNYVNKRLVATSDHDRSFVDKRLPVIPAATREIVGLISEPASASIDVDPELARWPEYIGQQNIPTGDLFRQAIWGSDIVPIDNEDGWQARSREDVMSDHPSSMTRGLRVA